MGALDARIGSETDPIGRWVGMSRQVVVLEVNEVPIRVLREVSQSGRTPALERLLAQSYVGQTEIREQLSEEPYPSQTWASLNYGVPYSEHGVWWYNDPKPEGHNLYWEQAARAGLSVGAVGTLHAEQIALRNDLPSIKFLVPDCFAGSDVTIPSHLEGLQHLNRSLVKRGSRTADLTIGRSDLANIASLRHAGLRPSTLASATRLVANVATGRASKERLRAGQFLLFGDLFMSLASDADADLSIYFTNHVAAAMHRYWYAMFPSDFDQVFYEESWVEKHRDEIPYALELLDRFIARLLDWCDSSDRALVLVSSMGQHASPILDTSRTHEAVVVDPMAFLRAIGAAKGASVSAAMHPQLTVTYESDLTADSGEKAMQALADTVAGGAVDRSGRTITLTAMIVGISGMVDLVGDRSDGSQAGLELRAVNDHSSGRHSPFGSLIVYNGGQEWPVGEAAPIDVMDYAPGVLQLLGVDQHAGSTAR